MTTSFVVAAEDKKKHFVFPEYKNVKKRKPRAPCAILQAQKKKLFLKPKQLNNKPTWKLFWDGAVGSNIYILVTNQFVQLRI